MYNKHTIIKISLYTVYAVVLVGVILLGFEWGSTYVENQQQAGYEEVPFELKLKSAPQDVLYSEAYKTASGTDIVKYAYLAGEVSPILDEDISRRTPVSQTVVLETFKDEEGKDMEKLKTTFISSVQMYQDNGKWRQIEYATTTPEVFAMSGAIPHIKRRELAEKFLPGESVFAQTSTFYPNPNIETSSFDGYCSVVREVVSTTWSTVRSLGSADSCDDGTSGFDTVSGTRSYDFETDTYYFNLSRAFFLFNTSTLPDGAVISSAIFSFYNTSVVDNTIDGYGTLNLVTTTPASNTGIVLGDYSQVGSVLQAPAVDMSTITSGDLTNLSLNATGLSNISKTDVTKFGFREGHDLDNVEPLDDSSVSFVTADAPGTSQDPKLEVTYTVSASSFGMWFPF